MPLSERLAIFNKYINKVKIKINKKLFLNLSLVVVVVLFLIIFSGKTVLAATPDGGLCGNWKDCTSGSYCNPSNNMCESLRAGVDCSKDSGVCQPDKSGLTCNGTTCVSANTTNGKSCSNGTCPSGYYCNAGCACVSGTSKDVCGSGDGGIGASVSPPSGSGGTGNIDCGQLQNVNGVCVPKSGFDTNSIAGVSDWQTLILKVLQWLMILVGVVAVVAIVIGGFWYITSGGNEETAEKGRKMLINAIIGLIIVILAYTIVTVLTNLITRTPT
jgi:hypothetical protein